MTTTTYAAHAQVQSGSDDFLHYTNTNGSILFAVNSSGNIAVQGGISGVGLGGPVIVATVNASLGFAVFNTAAAVNLLPSTVPTGVYQISMYMVTTTTFVTNTEEVITFGWNDASGAQTLAFTTGALTAGTTLVGSQLIQVATGTAVTYTPSKTGSAATAGVNQLAIVVTRVI